MECLIHLAINAARWGFVSAVIILLIYNIINIFKYGVELDLITLVFYNSDIIKKQWERYQKDNFYAKDIEYGDLIESLKKIGKIL